MRAGRFYNAQLFFHRGFTLGKGKSMKTLKKTIRKCYDIRGLSQTIDYCAEVFNVNRLRMQEENL